MRSQRFVELRIAKGIKGEEEGTDFQATKLSRDPRVTVVLLKLADRGQSPMRTLDNDWEQRQCTATSLIVTAADCFMTVLLFRRTYGDARPLRRLYVNSIFEQSESILYIFST